MKTAGADVIVVLSHLGFADGGYGYGIPVYGDQTLAAKLNDGWQARQPDHRRPQPHRPRRPGTMVGNTTVVQSALQRPTVGQADVTVGHRRRSVTEGRSGPSRHRRDTTAGRRGLPHVHRRSITADAHRSHADLALVNTPVGYSAVDLGRSNTGDNMMGAFIDDAIYNYLNTDADPANDVDLFFNNAGGIRTDWCWNGTAWATPGARPASTTPLC